MLGSCNIASQLPTIEISFLMSFSTEVPQDSNSLFVAFCFLVFTSKLSLSMRSAIFELKKNVPILIQSDCPKKISMGEENCILAKILAIYAIIFSTLHNMFIKSKKQVEQINSR